MKKVLLSLLLFCGAAFAQHTTTITDTLRLANGTGFCSGTISLSWNTFYSSDGYLIAAGTLSVPVNSSGYFTVNLVPTNTTTAPAEGFYSAVYQLQPSGCAPATQTWTVPLSGGPYPLSAVTVIPTPPGPLIPVANLLPPTGGGTSCIVFTTYVHWQPGGCSGAGGSSIFTSYQFGSNTAITGTSNYLQTTYPNIFTTTQTGTGTSLSPFINAITLTSQTANLFFAAPNGSTGAPSFRAIVAADVPTLNQNTTGTAGNITGILARANGGLNSSTPGTGIIRDGSTPTASELSGDATTSGSNAVTVKGLNGVPFCTGYTPTTGEAVQYTTGSSPNPCYTAASTTSSTFSVKNYGAAGNGVIRVDGSMNSGSGVLTSASGTFTSADVGKYVQVIGAGPGGTTHTTGAITSGLNVFTDSSGTFAASDVGRHIYIAGAGPAGGALTTQISGYTSATSVTLLNNAGTSVAGASYWYGGMTLEGTISTYTSATQVTLSANASASIRNARYVYGTNDTTAVEAAINAAGAAGGGSVTFPASSPANVYLVSTPNTAANTPADMIIPYNNVALVGDDTIPTIVCRGAYSIVSGAVVRGFCVAIGNNAGTAGASNVSISNLVLDGFTDGNTWNANFPASTTTGDGWDVTDKAVFINPNVAEGPITISNTTLANFKGELVYFGGTDSLLGQVSITDSNLSNTNGDGLSVSAQNLIFTGNTLTNIFNAGIENGADSTFGNHLISGNTFIDMPREAIDYVLVQNNINTSGSLNILSNVIVNAGWYPGFGYGSGYQAGIVTALQSGTTGSFFTSVNISGNVCHDCIFGVEADRVKGGRVTGNTFIVDTITMSNGAGYAIDLGLKTLSDFTVSNNTGYLTPLAITNSVNFHNGPISSIGDSAGAASVAYNDVLVQDNSFDNSGGPYFRVAASSNFFTALSNKAIIWRRNLCNGCVNSGNNGNLGTIANAGAITPILDQVWVQSGSNISATVTASYSQDGQEVRIINNGSNSIAFSADANMNLPTTVTVGSGYSQLFRYNGNSTKWELESVSGGSGGGGGAGAVPYTLCASGCNTTIPASGTTILASAHGQGKFAQAYGLNSTTNPAQLEPLKQTVNPATGDITPTWSLAPAEIVITGGTGGMVNPMNGANQIIGSLGSSGAPMALTMPSCSGTNNALIWASGTGVGCNTITGGSTQQVFAAAYNFSPILPGGTLTATVAATVTLTPGPPGVLPGATYYLYVSGGSGTAEAVNATGGSCTGVAVSSCTVTFTPANNHSGAWTVRSASGGIKEALVYCAANTLGGVIIDAGSIPVYGLLDISNNCSLAGEGLYTSFVNCEMLSRCVQWLGAAGNSDAINLQNLTINYAAGNGTSQEALHIQDAAQGFISNVGIDESYDGMTMVSVARVTVSNIQIIANNNGVNLSSNSASTVTAASYPAFYGGTILLPSSGGTGAGLNLTPGLAGPIFANMQIAGGKYCAQATDSSGSFINEIQLSGQCTVQNSSGGGIFINESSGSTALGWDVHDWNSQGVGYGILLEAGTQGEIADFTLANSTIGYNSGFGIALEGVRGAAITGSKFWIDSTSTGVGQAIEFVNVANTGVTITGNHIGGGGELGSGTVQNGVFVDSHAHANINIQANVFYTPTNLMIDDLHTGSGPIVWSNNIGIDNVTPSVASAASIAFPINPSFNLTGTAGVTSVTSLFPGQRGTIIPAGAVTFTSGATIGNTITTSANVPVSYYFDGTKIWLH